MFWEILGIVIGFSAVMLLLSLLVTAAGQITQHLLGLRERNLLSGLEKVFENLSGPKDDYRPEQVAQTAVGSARERLRGPARKRGWKAALSPRPQCTEIRPEELATFVSSEIGPERAEQAARELPRAYSPMRRRFALVMRYVSLAWAAVIAVSFQVSTPELLERLSSDPELRARYEAQADLVLAQAATSIDRLKRYQDVSAEALAELESRHPDLAGTLEEASGLGKDKAAIVRELSYVLEGMPERRPALLEEYAEILDEKLREGLDVATGEVRNVAPLLALYDLRVWPHGSSFYASAGNWIGVLVTVILLTLGAPFWFNVLRGAKDLRDTLGGGRREGNEA